ncbi:hypothetical protein Cni_G13564 [Canna indica]|uniref:Uncharacterized protein n=1 Tax=Canna indica TaxID=4628 RepID=A0AAQ3KAG6_9LILI|nr:hypothetical protein Cni_G13564 [Canna indica]
MQHALHSPRTHSNIAHHLFAFNPVLTSQRRRDREDELAAGMGGRAQAHKHRCCLGLGAGGIDGVHAQEVADGQDEPSPHTRQVGTSSRLAVDEQGMDLELESQFDVVVCGCR